MPDEPTVNSGPSIDTVIRGFTDAELALREVAGAVERIRSASEQLDAARADQGAARGALVDTSKAVITLSERTEALHRTLVDTMAVLASLEPERLWSHLDDHSRALQHSSDRLEEHRAALRRLAVLSAISLAVGLAVLVLVGAMVLGLIPS
jgi:hypothetical protein